MRRPGTSAGVVVLAVVIAALAAIRLLAVEDWDPTVFTAFGEEEPMTLEYAQQKLGREVVTRPAQGHDGKFFFVQANDPWLLHPEDNAEIMDRPIYRSQRMLYPVIVGVGGLLPSGAIVWTMVLANIAFMAVGSWAVARIGEKHGVSAWVGVAFAMNVGLLSELFIDGAGIVAFSLACLGGWALEDNRPLLAALALTGSALTREVMLAFIAFVALFWLIRRKEVAWRVFLPPLAAVALWAIYVRLRIDIPGDIPQVREVTLVPFSGMANALTSGRALLVDYLVIVFFSTLLVVVPFRAWRSELYLTWGAVGFAVLGPFLTVYVWQKSFDISRALAPLITVFIVELVLARQRRLASPLLVNKRTGVRCRSGLHCRNSGDHQAERVHRLDTDQGRP
ncbi:MAG: hypothetical protein ACRDWS_08915 [Acidimicrobiia bacterium]